MSPVKAESLRAERCRVIVVGGGAAGMMAAVAARTRGAAVTLLERNERTGRKLYITGKGRCNLTNRCELNDFLANVPCNPKFLYSAISRFPPLDTMDFFERAGVPLKTERGNRVFPVSDRAADVIDALNLAMRRTGVAVVQDRVLSLCLSGGAVTGVKGEKARYDGSSVVLATGGLSYPATGSTGDGYGMAEAAGHTLTPLRPSLVPLEAADGDCALLQGLSLRNVVLTVVDGGGKTVFREQGELLFTHFGMSGPLILSASAHLRHFDTERYTAVIDLKPGLEARLLDSRILRDFAAASNRDLSNVLEKLLPKALIPVVIARSGVPPETKANSVTRAQRGALLSQIKELTFPIAGPRPVAEAVVTAGGVCVSEIDPGTMASKRTRGLYFAGEILDVDAYTGGFNLQIAWSTGRAAGQAAAELAIGSKLASAKT